MSSHQAPISGLTQRSAAVDFIDHRLAAVHPAFVDPPTRFDAAAGRYVPCSDPPAMDPPRAEPRQPPPAVAAMRFWDRLFPEAMALFQAEHQAPKRRAVAGDVYDIRDKPDWAAVYDELQRAKTVYDGKGASRHVKKGLRVFFDKVRIVRPALNLLPDVEYLSPVVGALQVVLDAATESTNVREEVANSFDDSQLEQSFGDIETFLALFPGDQVIEKKALGVVVSILKAVEDAVGYYLENIVWRASKAVLSGVDYKKSLRESLSQIQISSNALIQEAQTSNIKQIRDLWAQVRNYSEQLIENDRVMLQNQEALLGYQKQILDGQQLFADVQNQLKRMLEGYQQAQDRNIQEQQAQLAEKNRQIELLFQQNTHLTAEFITLSRRQTPSPQPFAQPAWHIPQEALRQLMGLPDSLAQNDMDTIAQQAGRLPSHHREKAEQLVVVTEFQDFLTALESRVLLLHGDFEGTHYLSALSVFCSTLVRSMEGMDRFLPLVFFCGCHLDGGGRLMIHSLLAQLLQRHDFDTSSLHHELSLDRIQAGELSELCALFVWLARRLPQRTTLLCLIDGIKYYERPEHADGMGLVLSALLDLTLDTEMLAVFKILIASPSPTTIVRQHAAFQGGRNTVSLAALPKLGLGPSKFRFARQLGERLGQEPG